MTFRTASALFLVVAAIAAFSRPAFPDDATAAAMAAIGAAGGVPGGAAGGAPGAKKKDEGGFSRKLETPQIQKTADGDQEHGKTKKNAGAKAKASKYRSTDLSESVEHSYRFNADGESLDAAPKKKAAAKTKKKAAAATDGESEKPAVCSADEACPAKSSDSDAF